MCSQKVAKHLLVVDDVTDLAEVLAALLVDMSLLRLTTSICFDGAQAVVLVIEHPPAVVVLDIDMPIMNGIDAAIAMRAALLPAELPLLVAMTGDPSHLRDPRVRLAFDHLMMKPVDIEQMLVLLNDA